MKNLFLLFIIVFTLSCCSKSENSSTPIAPVDQLPPATQTGANTVGCLVNGQVFLPYQSNPFGSPAVVCFYQFLNGNYVFSLGFSNNKIANGLRNVKVSTRSITLQQGQSYQLKLNNGNSAFAAYLDFAQTSDYLTNDITLGELKITRLDETNAIISGTFWYDAVNSVGTKVEVREGRFDMQYSQ